MRELLKELTKSVIEYATLRVHLLVSLLYSPHDPSLFVPKNNEFQAVVTISYDWIPIPLVFLFQKA